VASTTCLADLQRSSADPDAVRPCRCGGRGQFSRRVRSPPGSWTPQSIAQTHARQEPVADPEHLAAIVEVSDSWWLLRLSLVLQGHGVFEAVLADPTLLPADEQVEEFWPEELLSALEDRAPDLDAPMLLAGGLARCVGQEVVRVRQGPGPLLRGVRTCVDDVHRK